MSYANWKVVAVCSISAIISAISNVQTNAATDCLSYEHPATVEGVIVRRTYPGPPNYESVAAGDKPETYWLIRLPHPVCVKQDLRSGYPENIGVVSIDELQLLMKPAQYSDYQNQIGMYVRITGMLEGAMTGHNHTLVMLSLDLLSHR
jgi:hypothetical protein